MSVSYHGTAVRRQGCVDASFLPIRRRIYKNIEKRQLWAPPMGGWNSKFASYLVRDTSDTLIGPEDLKKKRKKMFAKNRYTWSLWCQKQVHSKTKHKAHSRSPAIGQPYIVPVFGLKRSGTPGFVYLSSFQLFLANFKPIRGHTLVPWHISYDVSE